MITWLNNPFHSSTRKYIYVHKYIMYMYIYIHSTAWHIIAAIMKNRHRPSGGSFCRLFWKPFSGVVPFWRKWGYFFGEMRLSSGIVGRFCLIACYRTIGVIKSWKNLRENGAKISSKTMIVCDIIARRIINSDDSSPDGYWDCSQSSLEYFNICFFEFYLFIKIQSSMKIHHVNRTYFSQ